MTKNDARKGFFSWTAGAAFAVFSGAVALGWLHRADLWVLGAASEHPSGFLENALSFFSFLGGLEVAGVALLALLAGLFFRGRRALARRILAVFVATGLLEHAMKLYLPQVPTPKGTTSVEDYAPLVAFYSPYSYPSGHMLRGVIVFGVLYLLSESRLLRAGLLVVLAGLAVSRVYLGTHWASDVVGGALLGLAALLWAFSSSAPRREDERGTSA